MRSKSLMLFAALATLASVVFIAPAAVGAPSGSTQTYIVQMTQSPVVAYTGGIAGLKATKPAKGQKIDPASPDVVKYVNNLKASHDTAIARVQGGAKLYDYAYTYNGFAAQLTEGQAAKLEAASDVAAVTADELQTMDTSSTPHFLGLDAAGGLWEQLGGPTGAKGGPGAGEGMIIGDIDSGIWPQAKSFSDRDADGKLVYQQISGFHGKCESADIITDGSWDANLCNKKLIAAQHFNAAWGGDAAIDAQRPWEFTSPRDYNGHGTHTASTAGGNNGVQPTGPAAGFAPISGMAPRARIAAYKALWSTQDASTASGFTSDLTAAIDQAVADGVDAINYSISGTQTNFADPVEISFLFAADAGVFVSASAGNAGTTGSVAHPGPWLTTVAAGTHNRNGQGSVTLGNGATYTGASLAAPVGPVPIVLATASGLPGADPNLLRQCFSSPAQLDPAKVAGKIVVCERGGLAPANARVDKSLAVKNAGGVGMVLYNVAPNSLNADFHSVPTVHINDVDGAAVVAYVNSAGTTATAKINQSTTLFNTPAPFTAAFSSRGPLTAGGGDLLKPDVMAPGVDILAAVAPPGNGGLDFNLLSGTSMSAPHVAGVGTLLKQLHPNWSPMMIKSALMTSGYDVLDGGISDATRIFRQGAGHIKPNSAADPGLVFDSGFSDWLAFLCGTTAAVNPATCATFTAAQKEPSNLNVASIAIGDLAGAQTVMRTVKSVGSAAETYTPSYTGLAGFTVALPAAFAVNPGATAPFNVTFTRTTATLDTYVGGQVTLTGSLGHIVRIPIVLRPVALAAPASVSGTGGAINYNVTFGYTGAFTATARGLIPATTNAGSVGDDPGDSFSPGGPGTTSFVVNVPAGTTYARFSLFNANVSPASDLDLYVFNPGNSLVGSSGGGTSAEEVNLLNPAAGNYTVWVHGFAVPAPGPANFTLFHWELSGAAAGNMAVNAPASATLGTTAAINLTFSGLAAATKYLGSVAYGGVAGLPNPTIVRVDTP